MKEKLAELKRMKKQAKEENDEGNKIAAQIAEKVNLEDSQDIDKEMFEQKSKNMISNLQKSVSIDFTKSQLELEQRESVKI